MRGATQCPPGALDWAHRAPLLLAEIEAAGLPDLVCLQEVNHFGALGASGSRRGALVTMLKHARGADELAAALRALGYDGVFAEKARGLLRRKAEVEAQAQRR